jgi:colanic acid/amylovoran biosynthesis glycosyltransferase
MSELELADEPCTGINVLTITATFPSLIQPWLVNQLVQIINNGGSNHILARREELGVYPDDVDRYDLLNCYRLVPETRAMLVKSILTNMLSAKGVVAFIRGILKYPGVLFSKRFTYKEKLFSLFLFPYFGMRKISIIHSHSEMAGNKLLPIVHVLNKPLVVTFHGLPPVGVKPISAVERLRYSRAASVILVNTEFAKRQYVSLGAEPDKIKILPQGINLGDFKFQERPFPIGEVNVLTVGRFHPDKGQKYALQAVASLIKKGVAMRYRLVGNGPDRAELECLSIELGIERQVEFYSGLNDSELRDIYAKSHLFILPSLKSEDGFHEETQGVVLQEAQAVGLITLATKTGGIPECIDDGVSGFLVEDRSAEAIANKLSTLISESDKWSTYQKAGRKWVEDRYDIDVIGKKINAIYKSLIVSG